MDSGIFIISLSLANSIICVPFGKREGLSQYYSVDNKVALSLPPSRHGVPTHLPRQREAFLPYDRDISDKGIPHYLRLKYVQPVHLNIRI